MSDNNAILITWPAGLGDESNDDIYEHVMDAMALLDQRYVDHVWDWHTSAGPEHDVTVGHDHVRIPADTLERIRELLAVCHDPGVTRALLALLPPAPKPKDTTHG